jgi:predicted P-loop ATPase
MTKAKPSWDDLPLGSIFPGVRKVVNGKIYRDGVPEPRIEPFNLNQFGKPKANDAPNVQNALGRLFVTLRLDTFTDKILIEFPRAPGYESVLKDRHVNSLRHTIQDHFGFFPDEALLYSVLENMAVKNEFNSARDYFKQCEDEWDGEKRLEDFLIRYAGAIDTAYTRAVGLLPFVAAVRRVREPGAKFDEMLVLESTQGKNKSSAFEIMAHRADWFSDSVPLNADGREMLEATQGKIFVEVPELQGMKKAEIEHVKAVLSRRVDRGRMAYGRLQEEWPRQFVFIGTSNGASYLRDETGNRRFWPVAIKDFDLKALKRDADQVWGEAASLESEGLSIRLAPALYAAAAVEQDKRLEVRADPFMSAIGNYLAAFTGKITSEDAWEILSLPDAGRRTPELQRRMGAALRANGWQGASFKVEGVRLQGYIKGPAPLRQVVVSRVANRPLAEYADERKDPSDESWDD